MGRPAYWNAFTKISPRILPRGVGRNPRWRRVHDSGGAPFVGVSRVGFSGCRGYVIHRAWMCLWAMFNQKSTQLAVQKPMPRGERKMQKTKTYGSIGFPPEIIQEALDLWTDLATCDEDSPRDVLLVERGDEEWRYDRLEHFFIDFKGERPDRVYMHVHGKGSEFLFHSMKSRLTSLAVSLEDRKTINRVFVPLDRYADTVQEELASDEEKPTVFIGHGHSQLWRDLKEHLQDMHRYVIEAYESGARAGHSVRDILQEMLDKSSFALLVITAEDETAEGNMRARQNVVHELGLFQGRLGFSKAVAIVEEGVELSSNMEAIQQIRFPSGRIRETFGEVVATLERGTARPRSRR